MAIGKDNEIMEGSVTESFALCDNAVVISSKKIYGTTVGPHSRVGEVKLIIGNLCLFQQRT
jgi:hypothetical protein